MVKLCWFVIVYLCIFSLIPRQWSIFGEIPKNRRLWAKLYTVSEVYSYYGKFDLKLVKTTKECSDLLISRKLFLANGMFSTKISLVQGIRSETGAAHLRQFFLDYPHPGLQCGTAARLQNVTTLRQLQQHLTLYRLVDTIAFVLGLNDGLSCWNFWRWWQYWPINK